MGIAIMRMGRARRFVTAAVGTCLATACTQTSQPSGAPGKPDLPATGLEAARVDARLHGLLAEARGVMLRAGDGFASRGEPGHPAELMARLPARASEPRELRARGAARLALRVETPDARGEPGTLDEGRVVWRDAYPGVDMVAFSTAALYDELWVVREPSAPTTFRWRLSPGRSLHGPVQGRGGVGAYVDERGTPVMRVERPYAVDATGARHEVETRWSDDGAELAITFDHRALPHPVVIDPPVTTPGTWTRVSVTGPGPLSAASLVYSAWDGKTTLYGGSDCQAPSSCTTHGQLWTYGTSGWTQVPSTTPWPLPASDSAFFADVGGSRVRLYGGLAGTSAVAIDWAWSSGAWSELSTSPGPGAREGARAVWDPASAIVVLYGGDSGSALAPGTWLTSSGSDALFQMPVGTAPPLRRDHGMVWDSAGQRTLVFGGRGCRRNLGCPPLGDTWAFAAYQWSAVTTTGTAPSARSGHGMAYDTQRGVTVVFGGRTAAVTLGDTFELSGDAWSEAVASGSGPDARAYPAMTYDATRHVTVLYGGQSDAVEPGTSTAALSDTWEYAAPALTCTADTECATGHCVDGYCCDVASCGTCESCGTVANPGSCAAVEGPDADTCGGVCSAGACVKPFGASCTADAECEGGKCSSGVCCPTACSGACEACGSGSCLAVPAGNEGASCGNVLCDGTSRACPSCTTSSCKSGYACDAVSGECRTPLGLSCAAASDCASSFCVDGVCCDAACEGACAGCSFATGATTEGHCSVYSAGNAGTPACASGTRCDGAHPDCSATYACTSAADCASGVCIEGACCASLYDCGTKCSDDGTKVIDVASGDATPCEHGCYAGRCAAGVVDCRIAGGCTDGKVCGADGKCAAPTTASGKRFDPATPLGYTCSAGHASTGGGAPFGVVAIAALAWARRRRRARDAVLAAAALAALAGCGTMEAEDGEPCRQAGYSIASRIHGCTGDEALANSTYETLVDKYACFETPEAAASYQCAIDLRDTSCAAAALYGADVERWVASRPTCVALFTGGSIASASCSPLVSAIAPKVAACSAPTTSYLDVAASVYTTLSPHACIEPSAAALAACKAAIAAMRCDAVTDPSNALAWVAAATDCSNLVGSP